MEGLFKQWEEDLKDCTIPDWAEPYVVGHINNLGNGVYSAYYYAHMFELENGKTYYCPIGVKRPKEWTPLEKYKIEDGRIIELR